MRDPVFKSGDKVRCTGSRGYELTTGEIYTVLEYEPPYRDPSSYSGFSWPAYVVLLDDNGRRVHLHANRFEKIEEGSDDAH